MVKGHFDLICVIPLEEELQEFMSVFSGLQDLCADGYFRYTVDTGVSDLTMLVVQQEGMGKSLAARAVSATLAEYNTGLIVCLGIAGGLSNDLQLGDVCYTGTVIDVYDNAKFGDSKENELQLELSPSYFNTPRKLTASMNFLRTIPTLRADYEEWRRERASIARSLVPNTVLDASGNAVTIEDPSSKDGTIICGSVSKSQSYNQILKRVDRKILAIDTESGGVFEQGGSQGITALTIRGISDHANAEKGKLETETRGGVRKLAAGNAASFLKMQLRNPHFRAALSSLGRGIIYRYSKCSA
jgi:nucleoside phosphorylase